MTREQENRLIWKHTHSDYKGVIDGKRCILVLRTDEGTCSVSLDTLTDAERADKLGYALRSEARRKIG